MTAEVDSFTDLDHMVEVPFEARLRSQGLWPIRAQRPNVMQMNLGYVCNQQCRHCHHDSGPQRSETMSTEVMEGAVEFAENAGITEFDLTGGSPELHPRFRWLVRALHGVGGQITDRCNLTVLTEPGQEDMASLLGDHGVHVAASLPCYTAQITDQIRGDSVFEKSIAGLKMLNAAGYGSSGSGLELTLVHSPAGAVLPGRQEELESDYRQRLWDEHGVVFTRLITIANMPIGRFRRFLEDSGSLQIYMRELSESFNPATISSLMCRTMLSVGWDGKLYDCDFNQSLGIAVGNESVPDIRHPSPDEFTGRVIRCSSHCYGCTAGSGSSCIGELAQ